MTDSEIIMEAFARMPAWDWAKGPIEMHPMLTTPTTLIDQSPPDKKSFDHITITRERGDMGGRPAYRFMGRMGKTEICCAVYPIVEQSH